ncbi:MAG TPA: AsmA-like C-terminal region-containing protein [Vicinamibacteria bacterium]|nr:AsmA-like C-terminal region-containing protein [Vicinamibacteria bacterium]
MKKILLAVAAALAVVVLLALGALAWLLHSLDTPELKAAVLARTRATLGAEVRVTSMRLSVFSGLSLEGVTVGNPAPFTGEMLSARSFSLRYRLWPLLTGRLEVSRAALVRPQLNVFMDSRGRFNYEGLFGAGGRRSAAPPVAARTPSGSPLPVDLHLRRVTVDDGTVVMRDAARALLLRADGLGLDARFSFGSAGITADGKARAARLNLGDTLLVQDLSAPLRTLRDTLELAPIAATVAGGSLSGSATVNLKDFRYGSSLELEGADVATLLKEAHSSALLSGTLQANATVQGTGGLATLRGSGRAQVAHCRATNSKVLTLLSRVLQIPELANPDLDQCLAEFTLGGGRLQTPVLRMNGKQVQLTGNGTMNLLTRALDYRMDLALAQPLLNKITARPLRAAFVDRGDGFSTVDFTVTGTSDEPKTDLASKVGRSAAIDAVKGGFARILGRGKK